MNGEDMTQIIAVEQHKEKARGHWRNMRYHGSMMLSESVQFGLELNEIKPGIPHGELDTWLKDDFNLSRTQAGKYMKLATERPEWANVNRGLHLSLRSALALLANPEAEQETVRRIEAGEELDNEDVRKIIAEKEAVAFNRGRDLGVTEGRAEQIANTEKERKEKNKLRKEKKDLTETLTSRDPNQALIEQNNDLRRQLAQRDAQLEAGSKGLTVAKPQTVLEADPEKDALIESLQQQMQETQKELAEERHRTELLNAQLKDSTVEKVRVTTELAQLKNPVVVREAAIRDLSEAMRSLRVIESRMVDIPALVDSSLIAVLRDVATLASSIIQACSDSQALGVDPLSVAG